MATETLRGWDWYVDTKKYFPETIDKETKEVKRVMVRIHYLYVTCDDPILSIDSGRFRIVVRKRRVVQAEVFDKKFGVKYRPAPVNVATYSLYTLPVETEYTWEGEGGEVKKKVVRHKVIETRTDWLESVGEYGEVENWVRIPKMFENEKELKDWLVRRIGQHETNRAMYALENLK